MLATLTNTSRVTVGWLNNKAPTQPFIQFSPLLNWGVNGKIKSKKLIGSDKDSLVSKRKRETHPPQPPHQKKTKTKNKSKQPSPPTKQNQNTQVSKWCKGNNYLPLADWCTLSLWKVATLNDPCLLTSRGLEYPFGCLGWDVSPVSLPTPCPLLAYSLGTEVEWEAEKTLAL